MSNQNLYLVGTVHEDLDGKKRLDTLLDRISPSIVALEFHKDREEFMTLLKQGKINEMIDESGLKLNSSQRTTLVEATSRSNALKGYEFKSSRDYIKRNSGSRLEYIDISVFVNGKDEFVKGYAETMKESFKRIEEFPEILNEGIEGYEKYLREGVKYIYHNAEGMAKLMEMMRDPKVFEMIKKIKSPEEILALEQIFNPERDEAMGNRIRELYDGKSKLVAIVGLGHLEAIKTKIEDLAPRVMTLAEYDSL